MRKRKRDNRVNYILYIGNYLDEVIVNERQIPTFNKAGSNRMRRIADALHSVKQRIVVISSTVSLRMCWTGKVLYSVKARKAGKVPVLFCTAFGFPVIGVLLEPLFLFTLIWKVSHRRKITTIMIYNYSFSFLLVALWIRVFWRVQLIHDIEDIAVPRWTDWLLRGEVNPVRQLISAVYMLGITHLSDKVVIPTRRFKSIVSLGKPVLVVSGCIEEPSKEANIAEKRNCFPIRVLFAGKIEIEHGIHYFLRAAKLLLQNKELSEAFQIHICGGGAKTQWVSEWFRQFKDGNIHFHGFVSNEKHKRLLTESDVCVALQDPKGRFADYKVPSKVYEYLRYGKIVIATDVGDLSLLPSEVITICHPLNEQILYEQLATIVRNPECFRQQGEAAKCYARRRFSYPVVGGLLRDFILEESMTASTIGDLNHHGL